MKQFLFVLFILIWAAVVLLFGKRFFRALRARKWGDIILYGIVLSFLITFVEWFVYYAYALANPQVFL
ncbi:MAG: hypothetical protein WCV62_00410 [Candidatus Peribacteraceae bacterium]|jgi:hypothetical protein